jgi:hypothetical protein
MPTYLEALKQGGIYPLVINFTAYGKYSGQEYSQAMTAITSDTLKIIDHSLTQCTNIIYTSTGLHPDSLRHGYVNVIYGDTLTILVPADTTISGQPVSFDSIKLSSITGLPSSISYHPNAHHWPGSGFGCIYFSGTPVSADAITQNGIYPIVINMFGYGKLMSDHSSVSAQLSAITSDTLVIKNNVITGINEVSQSNGVDFFTRFDQSYNSVIIEVHSVSEINNASIIINDITGRELMRINNLSGRDFIFNKANLSKGLYIISLINNQKIIARGKVMVE